MRRPIRFTRRFLPALALALGAAVALPTTLAAPAVAQDDEPLVVGQTFLAGSLDPAEGSAGWALVSHGIAEQLFRVSQAGQVVPNLAAAAARTGDREWTVTLDPDRLFSDGTPVTAGAVAGALNRTGEANPSARASAGRLTFEAADEHTLVVETERPTPILPSILAEWAFPVYRMTEDGPIFTGPFKVARFESGSAIEMVPNPHYPDAEARPAVTLRRVADGQALALSLLAGELDLAFHLPVETLGLMADRPDVTVRSFPVAYQYMMWMNTAHPALGDVRVRRALDLAVDREALATAARAGVPATGAFSQSFPFAAETTIASDPDRAAALLDEAGWTRGADGQRARDGIPFALSLLAYPQRPDLVTFQPVIRAALEDLGIMVTTRVTETPSDAAAAGDFDLLLWAQHTAPAGDPAFFLSLFLETGAARNYAGWSHAGFDALLEELRQTEAPAERARLARDAQALIAEEAPVSFLLTPEWHVGLSDRLARYQPWGSDYYVIRPDFGMPQ